MRDIDIIAIITAVVMIAGAIINYRNSSNEAVKSIMSSLDLVVPVLNQELEKSRTMIAERDKVIYNLIVGVCKLFEQLEIAGIVPEYSIPAEVFRKWGNNLDKKESRNV